jgi:hypothetical protein
MKEDEGWGTLCVCVCHCSTIMSKRRRARKDDGGDDQPPAQQARVEQIVASMIEELPPETRVEIGRSMGVRTLLRWSRVSQQSYEESTYLFRILCLRDIVSNVDTRAYERLIARDKALVREYLAADIKRHWDENDQFSDIPGTDLALSLAPDDHFLRLIVDDYALWKDRFMVLDRKELFRFYDKTMQLLVIQIAEKLDEYLRKLNKNPMRRIIEKETDLSVIVFTGPGRRQPLFEFIFPPLNHVYEEHFEDLFSTLHHDDEEYFATDHFQEGPVAPFVAKFNTRMQEARAANTTSDDGMDGFDLLTGRAAGEMKKFDILTDLFLNCLYDISPSLCVDFPTLWETDTDNVIFEGGVISLATNGLFVPHNKK